MNSWYGQSLGFTSGALIGVWSLIAVVAIAIIFLKGYSLWYAARRGEKIWFIILLILNTAGILELVYIFFVVKGHKNPDAGSQVASSNPVNLVK
jgi:uncharacterized membrane protein